MVFFIPARNIKGALVFSLLQISCFVATYAQPIDRKATTQTVNLLYNLKKVLKKGVMFGHQDDFAYGVQWKYEENRSDVKDLTGDWPAVVGWDLGNLEFDSTNNLDGVPFNQMKSFIKQGYENGLINTISWHANNPLTNATAWDTTHGTVEAILPGGEKHILYKHWLDRIALFFAELKDSDGEKIPVLFRPYHELTGNWFWWCKSICTPQQFISLWRFTVTYLKDIKGLHNLLYVYSTANFDSEYEFLEYYPGDDFVDMISFDLYQRGEPKNKKTFTNRLSQQLSILLRIANRINKIPALSETGYNTIPDARWWTKTLWKAIKGYNISYVLVWRNAGLMKNGKMHYFVPYKQDVSARNFIRFYKKKRTLFGKQIVKEKIYEKASPN